MPATHPLLQEGRYRIDQEFNYDGIGSIYEAYDTVNDSNVVVKEIPVKLNKVTTPSQQEIQKAAFAEDARALIEIDHESLLQVHDFFSEIGRQYLVMEAIDGDDLQTLLERNKSAFPLSDVSAWADQLLDALNYLHTFRTPIIHRGIRPANIKLSSLGKIKLLAFALPDASESPLNTKVAVEAGQNAVINYSPLEQIWDALDAASRKVITSRYDERSERILKEPLDARSDIYSIGATLYHLVTARVPVDALERSIDILEGKPDPLHAPNKLDASIPPEVSDVLMKAMEIKREYRFDSAVIMRQVLRTALVRVREREAVEAKDNLEVVSKAAIKINADQKESLQNREVETKSAQRSDTERLDESKTQRQADEKRAVEDEIRLREHEAAKAAFMPPAPAKADDDLLGILNPPFDSSKQGTSGIRDSNLPMSQIESNPEELLQSIIFVSEAKLEDSETAASFVSGTLADTEADSYSSELLETSFLESPKPQGSRFGVPAIAAGIVTLTLAVGGGWMFLSSGTPAASKSAASESSATRDQPAAVPAVEPAAAPSPETPVSEPLQADMPITETPAVPPGAIARTVSQASAVKVKKTAPASPKAPAQKKPVTVDDLINDN